VGLVILVVSCTGVTKRLYDGPPKLSSEIALLKHQTGFGNPSVYFIRIDAQVMPSEWKKFYDVELLPGPHEVEFGYESGESVAVSMEVLLFEAEAGRQYEARAIEVGSQNFGEFLTGQGHWGGVIVELSSGRVVSTQKDQHFTPTPTLAPAPRSRLRSAFAEDEQTPTARPTATATAPPTPNG
jgi:hypothetical protein